ncbi:MAG: type II methionyl aminopeptidase, partial [Nanoarchaeota archaeon]|nr:type II methionyl aminopeptidase [Nanoarchaeota archaeon]
TAFPNEKRTFKDEIVKLDIGAHSDGYIGDNALTIDLSGKYSDLVKASRQALNNAIKIIQIGTALGEIGKTIQETIQSYGYEPVRNLSGHQLAQYSQHFGLSIPNYDTKDKTELKKGMLIAIEPFATTGIGLIAEKGEAGIFSQIQRKPLRDPTARKILEEVETYNRLPFASLWLAKKFPVFRVKLAIRDMTNANILHAYAPLVEKSNGMVSQAEHTLLIDDKVVVLTKGNFDI